jgi:hypothetical protein
LRAGAKGPVGALGDSPIGSLCGVKGDKADTLQ